LPTQENTRRSNMESHWRPSGVETARIVNVNVDDWSVDCVSEHGNKKYFDLQLMSPYFHFMNGEGIYLQPEVGAFVWICKPSMGEFAAPFVLGFQAPFDEDVGSFRCGRQTLNPGDMMMRTRDENFVVLRRGGVVQIGATPICQTIYVPINNIIRHFCEKFEINAFGGQLLWETHRRETSSDQDMLTTLYLKVKEKADDDAHIAELTIGSHGENDPATLELIIFNQGRADGKETQIRMTYTKEGDVSWYLTHDWDVYAEGEIRMTSEGNMTLHTDADYLLEAKEGKVEVKTKNEFKVFVESGKSIIETPQHIVKCGMIKHGSASATEPGVLGQQLKTILEAICDVISGLKYNEVLVSGGSGFPAVGSPVPTPVATASSISGPRAMISNMLAQKVKLE
jgi:hypothetical protein